MGLMCGTTYPMLQKLSFWFWPGINDESKDVSTEKESELIASLICAIHKFGNTKLLHTLSINVGDKKIQKNLEQTLVDKLSVLYGSKFEFFVTETVGMDK